MLNINIFCLILEVFLSFKPIYCRKYWQNCPIYRLFKQELASFNIKSFKIGKT